MAILNYLINDVKGNEILRAERGVPANSEVAAAIADAVNEVDPTYGIAVDICPLWKRTPAPSSRLCPAMLAPRRRSTSS